MYETLRSEEFLVCAMDKYKATVYALALSQLHNRYDAEDICQDVFLSLMKDQTEFRDEKHLKAWLIRVTLNRCRDFFRLAYNRHRAAMEDRFGSERFETPFENDIWESVDALSPKLRTVVHLFYGENYSAEEIAEIVGCTCAAVHARLHRARKKLKLEMGGNDDEKSARCLQKAYAKRNES